MNLKKSLENKIPNNLLKNLNNSYEIIGDKCILDIDENLLDFEKIVAEEIIKNNKNIKSVFKKTQNFCGKYRTRELKIILGEKSFETIYKENNLKLFVNIFDVYFSSKLSFERDKIFSNDLNKKNVLIGFCGVGPYTFNCLKKNPNVNRIDSIEINPKSQKYFKENLLLNKSILRKNYLYNDIKLFLKENQIFFEEKEILKNLIELKCPFFCDDFREKSQSLNILKYEVSEDNLGDFEYLNKEFLQRDNFELFELFKKKEIKNVILDLDNFEKSLFYILKFILIFFKNKKFFFKLNKKFYYVKDDFSKSIFLNFFESDKFFEKIIYDEIFLPAPKDSFNYLKDCINLSKENTIIHFYDFVQRFDLENTIKEKLKSFENENYLKINLLEIKEVSQISKSKLRVRVSFKILKMKS